MGDLLCGGAPAAVGDDDLGFFVAGQGIAGIGVPAHRSAVGGEGPRTPRNLEVGDVLVLAPHTFESRGPQNKLRWNYDRPRSRFGRLRIPYRERVRARAQR